MDELSQVEEFRSDPHRLPMRIQEVWRNKVSLLVYAKVGTLFRNFFPDRWFAREFQAKAYSTNILETLRIECRKSRIIG